MDPVIARKTWRTLEPIHSAIYFASEARGEYRAVGLDDRMTGYFASRSAPMGAVTAEVVIATFFNFDPDLVRRSMDGVWDRVLPSEVLERSVRVPHLMTGPEDDDWGAVESDDPARCRLELRRPDARRRGSRAFSHVDVISLFDTVVDARG